MTHNLYNICCHYDRDVEYCHIDGVDCADVGECYFVGVHGCDVRVLQVSAQTKTVRCECVRRPNTGIIVVWTLRMRTAWTGRRTRVR
jgi:hypothetical protein